ncbi:amidase [Micromonospora sp. NPDC048935]|uniref:amidase n=1 Tax=Micromonospora sp. NPDC048935 TaxID=3364262 RepID=UPI003714DEB9
MTTETTTESAYEALRRCARRTRDLDAHLGVFVEAWHERAMAEPPRSGPLAGLTLGVKDNIFLGAGRAAAGSNVVLAAEQPEAVAVARLSRAGAVVVGRTTMMEYALGLPGPDDVHQPVRNPWDTSRWAGGSSSGSGAGIIAGFFDAAIGTDTTGSLRIPAAYTGVTALKPTRGRVPTSGTYPLAPSLDTVGPMAASIETCARLLQEMAGPDPSDPWSAHRPVDDYLAAAGGEIAGLRIGVDRLTAYADAGIDPAQPEVFDRALAVLRDAGAGVEPVEVPGYPALNAIGNVIMLAEAHEIHADALAREWSRYGRGTRWVFSAGAALSAFDYLRAQRLRDQLSDAVNALFGRVDVLVTPTCHRGAPAIADMSALDPSTYLGSMHTTAWSVTGHPVATVPIGRTADGLPLSMSIVGPYGGEALVIRAAGAFQRLTDHHTQRPEWLVQEDAHA